MKELKGNFTFWLNYYRAAENSSDPGGFLLAIARFFYEGIEPEFSEERDRLMWELVHHSIAYSKRQSNRGQGAPAGNNNSPNGRRGNNQSKTNQEPNRNQSENQSRNQSENQSRNQSPSKANKNKNKNKNINNKDNSNSEERILSMDECV